MGMSGMYGPADRDEGIATIHAALDAGITLLDTGDFYGMGHNELLLARRARRPRPRRGDHQRQVRRPARPGQRLGRHGHAAGGDPQLRRLLAHPAGHGPHRHLPAGAPRSRRPDRGDRGRHQDAHRRGLRPPRRALRGRRGHDPPRRRRPPDRRPADRVLAPLPRDRGGDPHHDARARHRHHRLRRALPRPALRPLVGPARPAGERLPRPRAALPARNIERNLQLVDALRQIADERGATWPRWRSPGCSRAATTSCP